MTDWRCTVEPKAAWRGTIQFGIATVPVGLYTAVRPHAVHLSSVHRGCGGKVRMRKVCEIHGNELSAAEIQSAAPNGAPIDAPAVPTERKRVMEVRGFAPASTIDTSALGKPYHVRAESAGRKAYAVLRAALAKTRTVAVVTVIFTGSESLGILRPDGDAITLQLAAWSDEMIPAPVDDAPAPRVSAAELAAARALIESMPIGLGDVKDERNDALAAMVAAAPAPVGVVTPAESGSPADLMAALEASVKAARGKAGKR